MSLKTAVQPQMNTDLQPIAERPRLTRKVNAFAGGLHQCSSVSICGFSVSTAFFRITIQSGFGRVGRSKVTPRGSYRKELLKEVCQFADNLQRWIRAIAPVASMNRLIWVSSPLGAIARHSKTFKSEVPRTSKDPVQVCPESHGNTRPPSRSGLLLSGNSERTTKLRYRLEGRI